jgi:hypothetical protein
VTRVAGERDPPGAFSLPLGEGVCEEEPKATRDFSGVARVEEARRGASESSGAPTTEETRRDASSSPERRGRAGDRRSALGDVRARIFEGARRRMRPPGARVVRTKKKRFDFSSDDSAVPRAFVLAEVPRDGGRGASRTVRASEFFAV